MRKLFYIIDHFRIEMKITTNKKNQNKLVDIHLKINLNS